MVPCLLSLNICKYDIVGVMAPFCRLDETKNTYLASQWGFICFFLVLTFHMRAASALFSLTMCMIA